MIQSNFSMIPVIISKESLTIIKVIVFYFFQQFNKLTRFYSICIHKISTMIPMTLSIESCFKKWRQIVSTCIPQRKKAKRDLSVFCFKIPIPIDLSAKIRGTASIIIETNFSYLAEFSIHGYKNSKFLFHRNFCLHCLTTTPHYWDMHPKDKFYPIRVHDSFNVLFNLVS